MARLLEELSAGTPVRTAQGEIAGELRAVFGLGESRGAEFLLVYWNARGEETLVGAQEVMNIAADGTLELRLADYDDLPAYRSNANPNLHRL